MALSNLHTDLNPKSPKITLFRWVGLLIGLVVILGVVALAMTSATANPPSAATVQMQGWVNALRSDKLTPARHEAQRQLEAAGEAAVPSLVTALHSNDPVLRENAADMLGYIASPNAGAALSIVLASDKVADVRRTAAWALGEIKDLNNVPTLESAAASDRSQMVRQTALDSLARTRTVMALNAGFSDQNVRAMAIAPSQTGTVYLAERRNLGVSTDGGKNWQTLTNVLPSQVSALVVSPTNADKLYAAADSVGLFRSIDGGQTWTKLNFAAEQSVAPTITAIAIDPTNSDHVAVAYGVRLGTQNVEFQPLGLQWSSDGGKTWFDLSGGKGTVVSRMLFTGSQLYLSSGGQVPVNVLN